MRGRRKLRTTPGIGHQEGHDGYRRASSLLGSRRIAGVTVAAVGWAKKTARVSGGGVGGVLGGEISAKIASKAEESMPAQTPAVGRAGWLALTESELALATMKGRVTLKPVEVVARVPRSEVVSTELGKGVVVFGDHQ